MKAPLRLRLRKPRGAGEWASAGIVALAAATLAAKSAVALWEAASRAWPLLVLLATAGTGYAALRFTRAARTRQLQAKSLARLQLVLAQIDAMNDQEFEFALRDLLIRDGWSARRVGQQGDQAADVIGQQPQYGRIVIQAKHTTVGAKVGSHVMYEVKGTAGPVHGADIAIVVTNGTFTRNARAWGDRHHVHWIDRDRLRAWAEHGTPLPSVLRLPHRRRRSGITRSAEHSVIH
jgi:restriction system protein